MADEGTFLGEVQRGWQRFWRLSWWWKGAAIGVLALLVIGGIVAAVGGGDDGSSDTVRELKRSPTATATSQPTPTRARTSSPTLTKTTTPKATESPAQTATPTAAPTPSPMAAPSPKPTPQLTPKPTPAGPATTFGSGTHIVGIDIAAGTYRNSDSSGGCYWERLSGFGGTFEEVISNNFTEYLQIVTIKPSDAGFTSQDCGTWSPLGGPITSSPVAPFGGGIYLVGTDIAPGTWRNQASEGCYWERLSGFSGDFDDIISNEFSDAQQVVTISASDVGFSSEDCGTWTKIG